MPAQLVSFPVQSFRYRLLGSRYMIGVPYNWWQARKMTNASSAGLIPSPELQVQFTIGSRYMIGVPYNWWQARKMTNASSAGLIPSPELQVQATRLQVHDRGTTQLGAGQEDDQCQLSWSHS